MRTSRRFVLLGSASAAVASVIARTAYASIPLELGDGADSRRMVARMVRVMYPHDRFGDGPYERSAEMIIGVAGKTTGQKIAFAAALMDMESDGFLDLDDAAAYDYLKGMEETEAFKLVRGNAILTLYDDPEVWELLGYQGASFDQGGYVNRGFNDLDWLPEPRIEEYGVGQ